MPNPVGLGPSKYNLSLKDLEGEWVVIKSHQ